MAIVRERKSDITNRTTYQVLWKVGGKQQSVTIPQKAAAHRFLATLEERGLDAARRELLDPRQQISEIRLSEWVEDWLPTLTNANEGSQAKYRKIVTGAFIEPMGDPYLSDITHRKVALAVNVLKKRLAPKSIRNALSVLSSALERAVKDGHIPTNPCHDVDAPRRKASDMRSLDNERLAAIVDEMPKHYRPLILTMASTGLRWGEVTALQVQDVDRDAGHLVIRRAWKQHTGSKRTLDEPKSVAGSRVVSLLRDTLPMLERLLDGRNPDDFVFTTPGGSRITYSHFHERVWKPAVDRAKLSPRPTIHQIRHGHATWCIARGMPLPVVQVRLGHEDISTTTRTYVHVTPEIQRAALDQAWGLPAITAG